MLPFAIPARGKTLEPWTKLRPRGGGGSDRSFHFAGKDFMSHDIPRSAHSRGHDHDHDHDHEHGHGHGHEPHGRIRPPKAGILLAAFGAAVPEARSGYEIFESEVRERFPDIALGWAFTAHKVRRKLARRGYDHDSVAVALSRLHDAGVTHLAVQSLHATPGVEYHWTLDQAMVYRHPRKGFLDVRVGAPLLMAEDDLIRAREALESYIPDARRPDEAVVLAGHGTYHAGHRRYLDFQARAGARDPLLFVGTLMGAPGCDAVLAALREARVRRVWLLPFMSVPGHHVRVDIFGDHARSWKSRMTAAGFEVETRMTGILENKAFRDIWMGHLDAVFEAVRPQPEPNENGDSHAHF